MLSSKTTVMSDKPTFVRERSSVSAGTPVNCSSIGKVTNRSTSAGDSPGALVTTWTRTLVTSGNASIGMVRNAYTPPAASRSAVTTTRTRWRRENASSRTMRQMSFFWSSDLRMKAPRITTGSPSRRPSRILTI